MRLLTITLALAAVTVPALAFVPGSTPEPITYDLHWTEDTFQIHDMPQYDGELAAVEFQFLAGSSTGFRFTAESLTGATVELDRWHRSYHGLKAALNTPYAELCVTRPVTYRQAKDTPSPLDDLPGGVHVVTSSIESVVTGGPTMEYDGPMQRLEGSSILSYFEGTGTVQIKTTAPGGNAYFAPGGPPPPNNVTVYPANVDITLRATYYPQ